MMTFATKLYVGLFQSKVYDLIYEYPSIQSTSSLAMYPEEIHLIDEAFTFLTQALAVPPIPPTLSLSVKHSEAIMQVLDRWPLSQRFPGTLTLHFRRF
jgi:phospholipase A-2-activating protein